MRVFATCVLLLLAVSLHAAEPPKSPLSPEESLKHFVLADPNLQIEIVAAEPEVIDPVAIQFDEHGRLWVVELSDYPNGPEPGKPPMSRIKLLEDKDGDGRYETAHVFADKLLFATGVQPWDGGVIVTLAGEVAYFKDTDGDHKADVRETWFTGFAQANPQLRANHPTFGPDGWIYVANGLRGGNVIAVKKDWPLKARREGETPAGVAHDPSNPQPVSLTGRDFKFDPLTGRYEAISGNGQFGMTFDAWGNRFVCDNRHPCRHVIFEEDFIKRCPHVAFPAVVHDVIPADDKNRVFPLTSAWTTSNLHAGTFTAACGVTVYTGDWLPDEFRGNVFVCEPTGNLVQRAILESDGVTFKSRTHQRRRQPPSAEPKALPMVEEKSEDSAASRTQIVWDKETQEFLASRDDWFRPVDLQNGPDGALYVVDMYRAVIEHPEWVPDELKKRPDTWLGNDKGRIYRIRPKGERPKVDFAALRERPMSQIRSKNRWLQITARRLMTPDQSINNPDFRGLAAEVDYGTGGLAMIRWLRPMSSHLHFRKEDLKAGGELPWFPWLELRDSQPRVRFAALQTFALTSIWKCAELIFADQAVADASDPWARLASVAVAGDHVALLLNEVLQRYQDKDVWERDGVVQLVSQISEQVGARGNDVDVNLSIARLCQVARSGAAIHRGAPIRQNWPEFEVGLSGLLALSDGLARKGVSFKSLQTTLNDVAQSGLREVTRTCRARCFAEDASPAIRRLSIRWLRFSDSDDNRRGEDLKLLIQTLSDQTLRLTALEAFASFHRPDVDAWLVERYRSETPAIRRAILAALFASKERQLRLLEAIEQGQIAANELGPVQVNQLTQAKDETLRERAKTVLAAAAPASRHEVLDAYRPALAVTADPKRGREVFVKNCSTCHRVDNVGVNVAPDISDTRTKKPEQLLLDILDPNKAIDANYFAYAVVTKEGKTESGVISSETATSITLKQPEGKVLTLLRTDIDELRNTGLSLMPVGVEKNIDQQAMADLIFWLKNWRYLDGKVPATSLGGQ